MTIKLESNAISANQPIPKKYTGDDQDVSPPLRWSNVPEGCAEFALIVDDPDAPSRNPWVHWVIYKIPAGTTSLPEGLPAVETLPSGTVGAAQGKNSWGTIGYRGPAPPKGHGLHHYYFKLYALSTAVSLKPGIDKDGLLKAISGHIIGQGELVGTYQR